MNRSPNRSGICLIAQTLDLSGGHAVAENMLRILTSFAPQIFVLTSFYPQKAVFDSKIHLVNLKFDDKKQTMLIRIPKYILLQMKISYELLRMSSAIECIFFYLGAMPLFLPMLTAKLLGKRTIMAATGSSAATARYTYKRRVFRLGSLIFPRILMTLENINFRLADRIIVESEDAGHLLGLERFENKTFVNSAVYLDFDLFKVKKDFKERRNLVGYIGRLSAEKGVLELTKAVSLILERKEDIEFLIIGDGDLRGDMENMLREKGALAKVRFTGWIHHDELPDYMNELKLVIAPSYTEGGIPNAIKEAMACGVVALLSPAAAADITKDGEEAFILENNSPECITDKVSQVLEYPQIEKVVANARKFVEEKYSFENVSKRYEKILYETT